MYNVNNKGAIQYGGWNLCDVDTELKDHTLKVIARPNNDSLYITRMLDLRKKPEKILFYTERTEGYSTLIMRMLDMSAT